MSESIFRAMHMSQRLIYFRWVRWTVWEIRVRVTKRTTAK